MISNHSTGLAGGAAWLPSDRIVFNTGNSPVFEVSALGGETRPIIEPLEGEVDFHGLEALPGGNGYLTVVHKVEGQAFGNVTWVNGEERIELVHFPGEFIVFPRYSETGHIVFEVQGGHGKNGLWAVPFSLEDLASTGEPFLVTRNATTPSIAGNTLVYSPSGTVFVNEIVWVDRAGKVLETVGEPRKGLYPAISLSPNGDRAALSISERQGQGLWVMNLATGDASRVTFEEDAGIGFSAWESGGNQLAYAATTGGDDLRIMIKSLDGGTGAEEVTEGSGDMDFSPDGRFMVFVRPRPGFLNDLWWRNLEDGEESVFVQTDSWDILPTFSPDGRFVAHESEGEVFVTRFPEAEPRWQISDGGGTSPQWSADGRYLYFFNGDDFFEVTVDGGSVFRSSGPVLLFSFQQSPGDFDFMRSFAVDGNGERFLMVRVAGIPPGIVVYQNWLQGLRQ